MGQALVTRHTLTPFLPKLPHGCTLPDPELLAQSIANLHITVQNDMKIRVTFLMHMLIIPYDINQPDKPE